MGVFVRKRGDCSSRAVKHFVSTTKRLFRLHSPAKWQKN